MDWTPESTKKLAELIEQKASFGKIGKILKCGKSAAYQKAVREGLWSPEPAPEVAESPKPEPVRPVRLPKLKIIPPALERDVRGCCFILTAGFPWTACGKRPLSGKTSYCEEHRRICYVPLPSQDFLPKVYFK